jgi:hypothetical protein
MRKQTAVAIVVLGLSLFAMAEQSTQPEALLAALPAVPGIASPTPLSTLGMMSPIAPGTALATPAPAPTPEAQPHRFFDKSNLAIFGALTAARAMDPISTWQFRRHGLHEGQLSDGFVDNKPLFAVYSASLVAGQISSSYLFHRLGWHKLERISAMVHTGLVTESVVHNYRIGSKH